MNLLFTHHIMEFIRINAGSVHNRLCFQHTIVCFKGIAARRFTDILNFRIQFKFHTVDRRIFRIGNIHAERTDNPCRRCIERRHNSFRQIRLQFMGFFAVNDP